MASQLTLFGESTVNTRRTYIKESKLSVVAVPRCSSKINFSPSSFIASKLQRYNIDDLYESTLLSCTRATKKASRFWGVINFCLAVLEISVCGNNMMLATCFLFRTLSFFHFLQSPLFCFSSNVVYPSRMKF